MSIVVANVSKLALPQKIEKGQNIITLSTANPAVPGNTAVLTAFTNAQADLVAANEAHIAAQSKLVNALDVRVAALDTWNTTLTNLGAFTQIATDGVETKITSTGFDVRRAPTPPPPASAPGPVVAMLNGKPGRTKLTWPPEPDAKSFLVEQSPDPITETSWVQVATPTKASCDVDGAEPGKKYWFRVAAVSPAGISPWSEITPRPLM